MLGSQAMEKLKNARVAVFGIGGVGGHVAEALARSGIFQLDLIDNDCVSLTNLNRQIIALHSTIGRPKVEVMKERILDINPQAQVRTFQTFFLPENRELFNFSDYDYVVDAIDTVTAKLALIEEAKKCKVPVISSMGAGNKLDPTAFEVADISQTSVCPLARVMRQECKKRGISGVKVIYSREKFVPPVSSGGAGGTSSARAQGASETSETGEIELKGNGAAPGSCAFVPSVAGLIIASEVIKDLSL